MSKKSRAQENEDLLMGAAKPQGWRDQFNVESQEEPAKPDTAQAGQYRRKTYLMTDELIEGIEKLASKQSIGINEMHRYLVKIALEAIERGEHEIEVQVEVKRTLGV